MYRLLQSQDKTVTFHRISSGKPQFKFNCSSITNRSDFQDSVKAEFSVSMHGDLIYYTDMFGHVNALKIVYIVLKYCLLNLTYQTLFKYFICTII